MRILVYFLCLLTAQIAVASFKTDLSGLNSSDYKEQQAARDTISLKLAAASAPSAASGEYDAMLGDIYKFLESDSTDPASIYLIDMLALFGNATSPQVLYPFLGDSNLVIRDRATKALGALSQKDAAGFLMEGLHRGGVATRAQYMQALVYIGYAPAWESIAKLLASINVENQRLAAWSLGQLGVADAVAPLWEARGTVDAANLIEVETALLLLKPDKLKTEKLIRTGISSGVRVSAFRLLADQDPAAAISLLKEVLAEPEFPARPGLIHMAITHRNNAVQDALVDASEQLTSDEKIIMFGAISDQHATQYESLLLDYLKSDDASLARAAADALGWIGGNQSFEAMAAYTTRNFDDDTVVAAMGRLNAPAADRYYLSVLENPTDLTEVLTAIKLVQIRNSPNGVERLNALALEAPNPELQEAAFGGLEAIGNLQSIQDLLTVIRKGGSLKRPAQRSLKRLSLNYGQALTQWEIAYYPALQSAQTKEHKISIIQILDGVGCTPALEYLTDNAFDPELQSAVLRSLQRWPDYEVASAWVKLTEDDRSDESLRKTAASALRRTFKSESIDGDIEDKAQSAANALALSTQPALKQSIASGFDPEDIKGWQIKSVRRILKDFENDPDVSALLTPLFNQ